MNRLVLLCFLAICSIVYLPQHAVGQTTSDSIDVIYQSNSYTPPFYRGKALPSTETRVTLVATPNITLKNERVAKINDLTFTWERNGLIIGPQSGVGKNTILIKTERLPGDSTLIKVTVRATDGTNISKTISVPSARPSILIYENDPLLGVRLEKTTSAEYTVSQPEISMIAYPLYFETTLRNSPLLSYSWTLNNQEVTPRPGFPTELIVRRGESSGEAIVRLSIENPSKTLESNVQSFSIIFPESSQSPF